MSAVRLLPKVISLVIQFHAQDNNLLASIVSLPIVVGGTMLTAEDFREFLYAIEYGGDGAHPVPPALTRALSSRACRGKNSRSRIVPPS